MIVKVKLTQDHIDRGTQSSCWLCPIALALKDTGLFHAVSVKADGVEANLRDPMKFAGKGDEVRAPLPAAGRNFIKHFDRTRPRDIMFNYLTKPVQEMVQKNWNNYCQPIELTFVFWSVDEAA